MSKQVEQLIKTTAASTRKQCYHNLFQLLKSDKKDEIYDLCDSLPKLIPALVVDIKAASSDELSQSALRTCGTLLHNSVVATTLTSNQVRDVIRVLCDTIQNTTQKNDCILATWCLSVMGVTPGASVEVSVVLPALLYALTATSFHSPSLEQEAIGAIAKLLGLRPDDMGAQMLSWAPLVYVRLLSPTARVRDKAESILSSHTAVLCGAQSQLPKKVFEDLRGGLLTEMTEMLSTSGKEMTVIRAWGWFAQLAGAMFWHKSVVNAMLKLLESTFASSRPEVRLESYVAWRRLVLNLRTQLQGNLTPNMMKRLSLLLVPIASGLQTETEEQVRQACLQTWLQIVAAITVLSPSAQSDLLAEFIEKPLESMLKDVRQLESSVLRTAASEVLEVVAAPGLGAANAAAEEAPSREEAIEVREIRHLVPLPQAIVLRLLRIALEHQYPLYDRLERVWRRLLGSVQPSAEPHDPSPLVPLVKFAASLAENSAQATDGKKEWLGKSLYSPLLERMQSMQLMHVSPSPPLPDDRTLIGHLLNAWLSLPAATHAARAKQVEYLEPLLTVGHGLDALSFTATVVRDLNALSQIHPPGFMLGCCTILTRTLHRHLEVALRIGQSGAHERDFTTIFDVLRMPLVLALRPEVSTDDTPTIAEARNSWHELFSTLHRHALLGGAEKASAVVEDLAAHVPTLPLPLQGGGLPLWSQLAAQTARLLLENFQWTKGHRSMSPKKHSQSTPQKGEDLLRIAGEATELVAGMLQSAQADAARVLTPVQPLIASLPQALFMTMRAHFLPHWTRAVPQLLTSQSFSAISTPFAGVWDATLDALRRTPTSTYDTALLNAYAIVFREGFMSPERGIRSPAIEAWNTTFGRGTRDVVVPAELLPLLQSLRKKGNLLVPKQLLPSDAPHGDDLLPPTPDEELMAESRAPPPSAGADARKGKDRREEEKLGDKRAKHEPPAAATTATIPVTAITSKERRGQSAYVPVAPPAATESPRTEKQLEAGKRKAGVAMYSRLDPSSLDGATQEAAELDPRKSAALISNNKLGSPAPQAAQQSSVIDTPVQNRSSGVLPTDDLLAQVVRLANVPQHQLEAETPEALHGILRHALALASRVTPLLKPQPRPGVVSQYY